MATKMDKRLPVTANTHKRVTEFRDGAGMTYDQVINMLLDEAAKSGTLRSAGARWKYEIETGQRTNPTGSGDLSGDEKRS
jgi:phage baseplate assembly protein gpV